MRTYKRRPMYVEAIQITPDTFDKPHPNSEHIPGVIYNPLKRCAYIDTPLGTCQAVLWDWIVLGEGGQLYPCKNDVFATLYEVEPLHGKRRVAPLKGNDHASCL